MSTKELSDFCVRCGDCCKHFVINLPAPQQKLVEFLKGKYGTGFKADQVDLDVREDQLRIALKIPCMFLRDNECMIYDDRPEGCRNYFCDQVKQRFETWKSLTQRI